MNNLALKGRRVGSGMKQKNVAEKLGITPKTYCQHENAKTCKFTPEQIKIMAELFKLTLEDVNTIFFSNALPNGKAEETA